MLAPSATSLAMRTGSASPLSTLRMFSLVGSAILVCLGMPSPLRAQVVDPAILVEEDWELVVATPDPNSTSPQISCALSPVGNVDGVHATFELNHQSLPEFVAGGLQLQLWNGETNVSSHKFPNPSILNTANERVTWTQSVRLADGSLEFQITNGNSTTWGSFGGQGYLRRSVPTSLTSLDGYSPNISVQNSGVTYAAHRVTSLKLIKVRMVLASGLVLEDDTDRVVHQQP